MTSFLISWIQHAWQVASRFFPLMSWNLFLAFIPLVLSCWLFQMTKITWTTRWWFGVVIFILFLPNAPYVLTDIIHLIHAIRFTDKTTYVITLVLIPQFCIFMGAGFLAYVFCLLNVGAYLRRENLRGWVPAAEIGLHALSAIGIFLGRFRRFNSWDAVTQPTRLAERVLDDLFSTWPLLLIGITFFVLTVLYWIGKMAVLGWLREYPRATALAQPLLPSPSVSGSQTVD